MASFVLKSRRVLVGGELMDAAVLVRDGRIASIETERGETHRAEADHPTAGPGLAVLDCGDRVVLPGLVDCHAHLNEPGRTEWEGFATGTSAAAAGGVTTLVDMPLNSIPATTTRAALDTKAAQARTQCSVDYAFWGGVIPGNAPELEPLADAGVVGFKCFLCPSGVDEFPHVSRGDLEIAMPILARLGVPLIVHAELEDQDVPPWGDAQAYGSFLASRPRRFENAAIRMMVDLCRKTGCQVHIVHLSSADALPDIRAARAEGLPFSAETCPHYLTFASEDIPAGATAFKCAPPIREAENRERLWEALREGVISLVVSDHSPCTASLKKLETGDFRAAWGGISSLQLGLSIVWTGARARGIELARLAPWMSAAPAELIGLAAQKGAIRVGCDADFVVFDPDASFRVEPATLRHRNAVTPYADTTLLGRVEQTLLRGERIFTATEMHATSAPLGVRLERPRRKAVTTR